jgi:hypothetical protein
MSLPSLKKKSMLKYTLETTKRNFNRKKVYTEASASKINLKFIHSVTKIAKDAKLFVVIKL